MTRPYSEEFLREIYSEERVGLGYDLARTCLTANIPAKYVAAVLEVTPLTVFKWYRGAKIKETRYGQINGFLERIQADLKSEVLPARNVVAAKEYIQGMLGREI